MRGTTRAAIYRWLLPALAATILLAGCDDGPEHDGSAPIVRPSATAAAPSPTPTYDDSAERWVQGVCIAFADWRLDLERLADGVALAPVPGDIDTAHRAALSFIDGVVLETDDLIVRLQQLDPPGVPNGAAIAAAILDGARAARGSFEQARQELRAVPAGDGPAYAAAIATTREAFAGAGATLTGALEAVDRRFDTAELSRILVLTPECDTL